MTILQAIILGLVQGLTEFLPVSSSGHLVLLHSALGITDSGLLFDVALHIGTLIALLAFFNAELWALAKAFFIKGKQTKLARMLAVATIPAVISGVLLQSMAESAFRAPRLVAITLIGAALLMLLAERLMQKRTKLTGLKDVSLLQTIVIGIAQAISIIPGISRSGSTITAGLFMGLDRIAALRFSFLLGIPITAGAIVKVLSTPAAFSEINQQASVFIVGIVTAFISGTLAIRFLLKFLSKHSLDVFAYYRLALGSLVLLITFVR